MNETKTTPAASASLHTPGPWILRPSQYVMPGSYQITTLGAPMTLGFVCHDIPEGEADARLIAAGCFCLGVSSHTEKCDSARAALAKAKGGVL